MAGTRSIFGKIFRPAVVAIGALWLAYMAAAGFVIGVDPYDLYPWGVKITAARRWDPDHAPRMIDIAAKDPDADLVLVGTSPTALVTPEEIRTVFPEARAPWNVSYLLAGPDDRLLVLDHLIRYSHARHFIVTVDFYLTLPLGQDNAVFPENLYDASFTNDLRVVDQDTLKDALRALRRGTPFPDTAAATEAMRVSFERVEQIFRNPDNLNAIRDAITRYRATIDSPGATHCASFPMLEPFVGRVKALAAGGRTVDLLIPAFSPSAYYRWRSDKNRILGDNALAEQHRALGSHAFADQLLMRRCLVKALDGVAGVTVAGADLDFELTGRIANFFDPTHLNTAEERERMLGRLRDPRYRLTAANVDAYAEAIRRNVKDYCPQGFPQGC